LGEHTMLPPTTARLSFIVQTGKRHKSQSAAKGYVMMLQGRKLC
jgi:hypothetical protein